jgi:hypothetical protein
MMIDARPVRIERVLAQRSGETLILLNPHSGKYYTLDEIGTRVWEMCDGSRSVPDLVCAIHDEYDASPEDIHRDVMDLLDELARETLLATDPAAVGSVG